MSVINASRVPAILAALCLIGACTSYQQAESRSGDIEQAILSGQLPLVGEQVRLATADGTVRQFRVTAVDSPRRLILGQDESVPIADIVAIETREMSMGKTAALAGGVAAGVTVLALIILAMVPAIVVL